MAAYRTGDLSLSLFRDAIRMNRFQNRHYLRIVKSSEQGLNFSGQDISPPPKLNMPNEPNREVYQ